jgi:hypothetical protein
MGCVFAAFVVFFGTYTICYNVMARNALGVGIDSNSDFQRFGNDNSCTSVNGDHAGSPSGISASEIGCMAKLGAKMESFLERSFTWWGTWCARHPYLVLVSGLLVCGALAAGISQYKVTTNPVDLWSAPDSRARTEKDYFDSHFV